MEKPYAVVHFFEQNTYSEIPSNWLMATDESTGITECKWPPTLIKNFNFQFKNRITPADNWNTYKVKIVRYCDTLIQARKAAEDSESSASEAPRGKGHRSKLPSATAAAAATSKHSLTADNVSSDNENDRSDNGKKPVNSPVNDEFLMDDTLVSDHSKSMTSESDSLIIDGDDDKHKLDSCLRLLGTLMVDMRDLKERVVANNDANNHGEVLNEIRSNIKNDLPLNSKEEVSAFNTKLLESKNYCQEFVKVIKQIGGAHGKEYTERVLNTIFSTSFAAENSWEGKKTKYKLNDLKVVKTCEEVILEKFPPWSSAEFSKVGTNWFRLGNQRAGLQNKQIQKQKKHEDTTNNDLE
ncbi:uncharacterized protein LOC123302863 [Chrysoperla carnea]|uniref:uncharacterized protein LOC123302863 n=1 Tax=Chrysoperla carnea TaxID=189513 RepID=UPI001D07B788|nr:uncharacterized protein LOC123302863 [Chrysoperla carnea]